MTIKNDDDIKCYEEFYDTGNFEVFCFCLLSREKNNYVLSNNNKNEDIEYFLVGGFDTEKNKGIIKLYEIIYNNKIEKIGIKYNEDINFEKDEKKNFNSFEKAISCIIQSKIDGKIFLTCLDGNVYSLTKPNFDFIKKNNIDDIDLNN